MYTTLIDSQNQFTIELNRTRMDDKIEGGRARMNRQKEEEEEEKEDKEALLVAVVLVVIADRIRIKEHDNEK